MLEVGVEVEPRHDVGRVPENEVVQCEQAAFDVRKRREHQLVWSHLLYANVTAHTRARKKRNVDVDKMLTVLIIIIIIIIIMSTFI